MPMTGAMYASNRNHDQDSEVDSDKQWAFIDHQATMASIKLTHVPVHDRIRTNTSNNKDRARVLQLAYLPVALTLLQWPKAPNP